MKKVIRTIIKMIKKHGPAILAGLAMTGVVATAVSTAKHTPEAMEAIAEAEEAKGEELTFVEKTKATWKVYVVPAVAGALTMVCIGGSAYLSAKKINGLIAAFVLAQGSMPEITKNSKYNVIPHDDFVQFYDPITGIAFWSSVEDVKDAFNKMNKAIAVTDYCSLDNYCDCLKIARVNGGSVLGWTYDLLADEDVPWLDYMLEEVEIDGEKFLSISTKIDPSVMYEG